MFKLLIELKKRHVTTFCQEENRSNPEILFFLFIYFLLLIFFMGNENPIFWIVDPLFVSIILINSSSAAPLFFFTAS